MQTIIDRAANTRTTVADGVAFTAPLLGIGHVSAVLRAAGLPHGLGGAERVGWHAFRGAIVRHHAPVAVRWFADAPSPHTLAEAEDVAAREALAATRATLADDRTRAILDALAEVPE